MHTTTLTVCVCVWHFGGLLLYLNLLTEDKSDGEIAYGTPSFKLGSSGKCVHSDTGIKYVMLEQLAQFCFCFTAHKSFTVIILNTVKQSQEVGFKIFHQGTWEQILFC